MASPAATAGAAAIVRGVLDAAMIRRVTALSPLERARLKWQVPLPRVLQQSAIVPVNGDATSSQADHSTIKSLFPLTYGQPVVNLEAPSSNGNGGSASALPSTPIRLGVVLSGGPASGGHNVISGLFDMIHRIHADSRLFGFTDGPSGLIDAKYVEVTKKLVDAFRNQGGFNMLGSGRTKIETAAHFEATAAVCAALQLDGLVIVGGDDSNTNAALLAEYFLKIKHHTRCVGTPKTIDNDMRDGKFIEASFGFDTATKVYSEQVAALCADAVSARKTYHVIKLMGRQASHITLEVALQCHPNVALIGEEIQAKGQTLSSVIKGIADVVSTRAAQGKHFGCIILPEGLVEFMGDVSQLIRELNELMAANRTQGMPFNISAHLTRASGKLFATLPSYVAAQLLLDRDPHGNVQVAKIESERLVASLVETELARRKKLGTYKGSPSFVTHSLGYSGRCGMPSNFDAAYCYALGHTAAILLATGHTGLVATVQRLTEPTVEWTCGGLPLTHLMNIERRHGHDNPVIRKALVDLDGLPFQAFEQLREAWKFDGLRNPGSIQYYEQPFADCVTLTLELEQWHNKDERKEAQALHALPSKL